MIDLPLWLYRALWIAWIATFVCVETLAILDAKSGATLTERVRPLMHHHPLVWFLSAAFFAWLAIHFVAPDLESWLSQANTRWGRE